MVDTIMYYVRITNLIYWTKKPSWQRMLQTYRTLVNQLVFLLVFSMNFKMYWSLYFWNAIKYCVCFLNALDFYLQLHIWVAGIFVVFHGWSALWLFSVLTTRRLSSTDKTSYYHCQIMHNLLYFQVLHLEQTFILTE